MAVYLVYRTTEPQRNCRGLHSALVSAADANAAIAASNALVKGGEVNFAGYGTMLVAATPDAGFRPTLFEGDAINLRGMDRGGNTV